MSTLRELQGGSCRTREGLGRRDHPLPEITDTPGDPRAHVKTPRHTAARRPLHIAAAGYTALATKKSASLTTKLGKVGAHSKQEFIAFGLGGPNPPTSGEQPAAN